MNRNSLPSWVNSAIDRIADAPMSPLGRVAARRMGRPAPRGSVPVTHFADAARRVLIAPVNYSGQGIAWARSLEAASPTVSARNMAVEVPGGFSFPSDLLVPVGTFHNDRDWQQRQFAAAAQATHFLIEAEEVPFGRLYGRSIAAQAHELEVRGVRIGHLAHGTDVRLPSRHAKSSEWSYYLDPSVYLQRAEQLAARNIALIQASGRRHFVSTPDLLSDLPDAHWCPVVVDPARWEVDRESTPYHGPLRVAHAPTNPILKGTPLILPVLERLADEGVIRLQLLQGVPSAQMPEVLAGTDVLLDQFRLGSYGVAACEALASGCAVVGQVSEETRAAVRSLSGQELPIIEANPGTLEKTLRHLSRNPYEVALLRGKGLQFVREVHDGRMSAAALLEHFIEE